MPGHMGVDNHTMEYCSAVETGIRRNKPLTQRVKGVNPHRVMLSGRSRIKECVLYDFMGTRL